MSFQDVKVSEFLDVLASKAAVPGGGGASALLGAMGSALGQMVCNLTIGKKKYAAVEADVIAVCEKCRTLMVEFEQLIDEDAVAFEPLSKAYGLPKETPEQLEHRNAVMEEALDTACSVPLKIMEKACECIDFLDELSEKGSALAISDVGVGAVCAKASLKGASLNIFINTDLMKNRERAADYESKANGMLDSYCAKADVIFDKVFGRITKK